jgi:glycosyltransferase involved in cell wall biosynthesis
MASLLWYLLRHGAEFDLFHVHLGFAQTDIVGLVAAMYRRPMWVKLAASGSLGEIQRMRHVARITRHLGLRSAARVQAISDPIRVEALAVGVSPQRLIRIPNGVDANRFRPPETKREKDDARKVLELPTGADIVLYVGRIARHKGIDDLLDAWRLIQSDGRLLVLVGSTETIDPADNPSAPRLILVGWSDRPELYYRAADMLVLPSHIEGMSNALLEAMSSGLAVVSSRIGAAEELIDPSVTGELVDVGDSDSLRRVVDELLADAPRRMRLGSAARATVVERYSIDAVALEISRGYDALT